MPKIKTAPKIEPRIYTYGIGGIKCDKCGKAHKVTSKKINSRLNKEARERMIDNMEYYKNRVDDLLNERSTQRMITVGLFVISILACILYLIK